jgi:hypothetical protein|tara:strand:- start:143 stop:403 length:261 start_codon:yes stop_codon:yes gene_type:complete
MAQTHLQRIRLRNLRAKINKIDLPSFNLVIDDMNEYEILYYTGETRNLLVKVNQMAKEGWAAKSIGGLGDPFGVHAVYVPMEREIS